MVKGGEIIFGVIKATSRRPSHKAIMTPRLTP